MAETNKKAVAETVDADLCATLDKKEWRYKRFDDDLVITFGVSGEDIPMEFVLVVDAERQLLRVFSQLPFTVPEDKRMDLAIATCVATNGLADGSFDYDIEKGKIAFRLTASFRESKIGEGLFAYIIRCSSFTVDLFNDKFFALSKGYMSINDFMTQSK